MIPVIFCYGQFPCHIHTKDDIRRQAHFCCISYKCADFVLYSFLFSIGSLWLVVLNLDSVIADFSDISDIYISSPLFWALKDHIHTKNDIRRLVHFCCIGYKCADFVLYSPILPRKNGGQMTMEYHGLP